MEEGKWCDSVILFSKSWCFPSLLDGKTVRTAENLLGIEQMDFITFLIALLKGTEIKQGIFHSSFMSLPRIEPATFVLSGQILKHHLSSNIQYVFIHFFWYSKKSETDGFRIYKQMKKKNTMKETLKKNMKEN